jgi:putative glutamine amidotransferase
MTVQASGWTEDSLSGPWAASVWRVPARPSTRCFLNEIVSFLRCLATAAGALWFNSGSQALVVTGRPSRILNVARSKPLIGIPADRRILGPHPFHCVGEKYISAVTEAAGAVAVLLPSLGEQADLDAILGSVDGILLTGSASNVEPRRYAGPAADPDTLHDPHRDATTLPLIPQVVAAGMPLFAICRGFQEMNVAFGGTLWQKVQEVPGMADHREDKEQPLDVQYGPAHEVELVPDGQLERIAGTRRVVVNSVHAQGVQRLGEGLEIEARAPDGLIEGFRVRGAPGFALAVQWHPEWQVMKNPFSRALFAAFGDAARTHAKGR